MNARVIAFVACRLFAVYLLAFYELNLVLQAFAALVGSREPGNDIDWVRLAIGVSALVAYGLAAVFLWTGAGWISGRISKPFPEKLSEAPNFESLRAMIILAAGWLAFLIALQQYKELFVTALARRDYFDGNGVLLALLSCVPNTALAVLLIAFPQSVAAILKAVSAWATQPLVKADDQ